MEVLQVLFGAVCAAIALFAMYHVFFAEVSWQTRAAWTTLAITLTLLVARMLGVL